MIEDKDESLFSDDDLELWKTVSQTIKPMPGKKTSTSKPKPKRKSDEPEGIFAPPESVKPKAASPQYTQLPTLNVGEIVGVDKSTATKLKEGKYPIDTTLDLHGKTQEEAFEALRYRIGTARDMGKRCVLVITGKGNQDSGVLKTQVPKWLNTPGLREHVVMMSYAKPQHGGTGALYVLLRKKVYDQNA